VTAARQVRRFCTAPARQSGETGLIVNRPSISPSDPHAEAAFDDYGIYEVGSKAT
jgi:hypothetical protein